MAMLSPTDLWEHQMARFRPLEWKDPAAFRLVTEKFRGLVLDNTLYNHEVMQMALDEVIGPEDIGVSLSCQADEYEETMKAQDILDSL